MCDKIEIELYREGAFIMELLWLGILIVLLLIEIFTLGLTTIWFAGGALLAFVAAELGAPLPVQIVLFLVVSLVLLIFTRPVALKYFNAKRTKTNSEGLIGKQAVVTQAIDNLDGVGEVTVNGLVWTARTEDFSGSIEKGKTVTIIAIDGVKLIVREDIEL